MDIQQWHWGKIVLVWLAALCAVFALIFLIFEAFRFPTYGYFGAQFLGEMLLLLSIVGPLAVAFRITWVWLSGKERR